MKKHYTWYQLMFSKPYIVLFCIGSLIYALLNIGSVVIFEFEDNGQFASYRECIDEEFVDHRSGVSTECVEYSNVRIPAGERIKQKMLSSFFSETLVNQVQFTAKRINSGIGILDLIGILLSLIPFVFQYYLKVIGTSMLINKIEKRDLWSEENIIFKFFGH